LALFQTGLGIEFELFRPSFIRGGLWIGE